MAPAANFPYPSLLLCVHSYLEVRLEPVVARRVLGQSQVLVEAGYETALVIALKPNHRLDDVTLVNSL